MTWNCAANSIFLDAIELPSRADRVAFIDRACRERGDLRSEALELLASYEQADHGAFLEQPPCLGDMVPQVKMQRIDTASIKNDSSIFSSTPLRKDHQPLQLRLGEQFGRYHIERVLGSGAMGVVYLATDMRLKRPVALKFPRLTEDPAFVERFEREARAMASIEHRSLCAIHDIDELDGIRYISMAYIDGETLASKLARCDRWPSRSMAELMHKLALATHQAHLAGVVHRDLKPVNIMIDGEGEPVIMDFGVALTDDLDSRITHSGLIIGTPAYMAPEQAIGDPNGIGPWTDLYSLGAILYELLTGHTVYSGSSLFVLGQLVSGTSIVLPSTLADNVDPLLESICMKLLSRKPEDRFPSAEDLACQLTAFLEQPRSSPTSMAVKHAALDEADAKAIATSAMHRTRVGWLEGGACVTVATVLILLNSAITNPNRTQPRLDSEVKSDQDKSTQGLAISAPTSATSYFNSPEYVWSDPVSLGKGVNTMAIEENTAVSADGLTLIFNRTVRGRAELWQSKRRTIDSEFENATRMPEPINFNVSTNDCPFLSQDGLSLWFASNRRGTLGPRDLWVSHRETLDSQWGEAVNIGPPVNTESFEQSPFVTADGLTLLFSRVDVMGRFKIYSSQRADTTGPFDEPRLLPYVNSGRCSSFPRLTADGLTLVYIHCRPNEETLRLWAATRRSEADDFASPVMLSGPINSDLAAGPSITQDGMQIFFTSNRGQPDPAQFDLWSTKLSCY